MADEKKAPAKGDPPVGEAPPISEADDGGTSSRTKGYSDNPDAPGDAVAQVENLKD